MAVRTNSSAVRQRIARLKAAIPQVATRALETTAAGTRDAVSGYLISSGASAKAEEQLGFDILQFVRNIAPIFRLSDRRYAILDQQLMGTEEDLEAISGQHPSLWHEHGQKGELFRKAVFQGNKRGQVLQGRQAIWREKTPQWIVLEYGASGAMNGPIPAYGFVGRAKSEAAALFIANVSLEFIRSGVRT